MSTSRALPWALAALGVTLAVWAAFQPALGAEFLSFDDPENLTRNHAFRGLSAAQLEWMLSLIHI